MHRYLECISKIWKLFLSGVEGLIYILGLQFSGKYCILIHQHIGWIHKCLGAQNVTFTQHYINRSHALPTREYLWSTSKKHSEKSYKFDHTCNWIFLLAYFRHHLCYHQLWYIQDFNDKSPHSRFSNFTTRSYFRHLGLQLRQSLRASSLSLSHDINCDHNIRYYK